MFFSYDKLHRVFAYLALFIDRIKTKCSQADSVPETQGTLFKEHHFKPPEQILVQDAQRNLNIKKYVSLQSRFLVKMVVWGKMRSSIIISGWLGSHLKCGYDREKL